LNNIRIESKENSLVLAATDSEVALQVVIEATSVETPGVISIPGNYVASILRETLDEEVAVSAEGESCELLARDSVYRIAGDDPHNFPFIPFIEEEIEAVELPVGVITDGIRKTIFATSKEKTRFALNGILVKLNENKLEMVATDGKRLALIGKELPKGVERAVNAIVPTKAMQLVERIAEGVPKENMLRLNLKENIVQFRLPNITLCAKLLEGSFPKYEEVIPKDYTKRVALNTGAFHSGMRRAALFTGEESKSVQFALRGGILTLRSHSDLAGDAKIELSIEGNEHEVDLSFNPEFLIEVLRVTAAETLNIEFSDFNRPVLLKSEEGYLNLVMPISTGP
jgi:DNA polymerase-3 subunit beta